MENELLIRIKNEIEENIEKRRKLLGKQNLVNSDNPNVNIHHLDALRELLNRPENIELMQDKDIIIDGKPISIPNTRKKIFEKSALEIKNPENIFVYICSIKIQPSKKIGIDKYFTPEIIKENDFYDQNIIGKIYTNFENPSITYFINQSGCSSFEKTHNLLVQKSETKNLNGASISVGVRNKYINELVTNGKESAFKILQDYYTIIYSEEEHERTLK